MTTSFIYLNVVCALLATMCTAGTCVYIPMACTIWLGASAYMAHRAGLLDEA